MYRPTRPINQSRCTTRMLAINASIVNNTGTSGDDTQLAMWSVSRPHLYNQASFLSAVFGRYLNTSLTRRHQADTHAAAQKYVDRKLSALALYRRSSLTSLPDRIRISQKSVRTSLRSTTRVRLQRGTARIRPPLLQSAGCAAIDRHVLPAGPTAANLQQRGCCCEPMLGQTDG